MLALRWHNRYDVRLEDVPDTLPPGPDEVRVSVEWCGICGTDLEEYEHGPLLVPTEPHPLTGQRAPMTLGHEVSGRILDAGSRTALRPGQLVALDGYYFCGDCPGCRRHEVQLCDRWGHLGLSAPGGLTERLTVPAQMAVPATGHVESDVLALSEPFSVAVRALRRSGLCEGERVGVLGAGAIGLAACSLALARGAVVTVAEVDPLRRATAKIIGADVVPTAEALAGNLDVVLDCTGKAEVVGAALPSLRKGGRLVAVGIPVAALELDLRRVVLDELSLLGSIGHVWDEDFATAVRLICEQVVDPRPLITHRIGLRDAAERGFALLAERDTHVLKVLVSPNHDLPTR